MYVTFIFTDLLTLNFGSDYSNIVVISQYPIFYLSYYHTFNNNMSHRKRPFFFTFSRHERIV